jgi:hypothetical protein
MKQPIVHIQNLNLKYQQKQVLSKKESNGFYQASAEAEKQL